MGWDQPLLRQWPAGRGQEKTMGWLQPLSWEQLGHSSARPRFPISSADTGGKMQRTLESHSRESMWEVTDRWWRRRQEKRGRWEGHILKVFTFAAQGPGQFISALERSEFGPWVGKIPWRRTQKLTPVFLPGESLGQRRLADYSPQNHRVGHNWSNLACLHALLNKQKLWFCDICPFEHTVAAPAYGIWWINAPGSPSFCGASLRYVPQVSSEGLNCSGPWQWCVH